MNGQRRDASKPRRAPLRPVSPLPLPRPAAYRQECQAGAQRTDAGTMVSRRGKVVAGLIVAAMLASLGACSAGTTVPVNGAAQAPGSFSLQLHGQMTNAIGAAQP